MQLNRGRGRGRLSATEQQNDGAVPVTETNGSEKNNSKNPQKKNHRAKENTTAKRDGNQSKQNITSVPGAILSRPLCPREAHRSHMPKLLATLNIADLDAPRDECTLCAHQSALWAVSPDCGDCPLICMECGLKNRVESNNNTCRFCHKPSQRLIMFSQPEKRETVVVKPPSELFPATSPRNLLEDKSIFCTNVALPQFIDVLLSPFICWHEHCGGADFKANRLPSVSNRFKNNGELNSHLRQVHAATYCNLCRQLNSSNLPTENIIYPLKQLKSHRKNGDSKNHIPRHPHCSWCNQFFTDDEALILHHNKEHQQCTLCKKEKSDSYYRGIDTAGQIHESLYETDRMIQERSLHRGQGLSLGYINPENTEALAIYKDITELIRHNLLRHYPCPHEECGLVVYKDFEALRSHFEREHRMSNLSACTKSYIKSTATKPSQVLLLQAIRGRSTAHDGVRNAKDQQIQPYKAKTTDEEKNCPKSPIKDILDGLEGYVHHASIGEVDPEFTWNPEDGIPTEIGINLLNRSENTIKYLYSLTEDLGSLKTPMPLLENIMKMVTLWNQLHGTVDNHQVWQEASKVTFADQPKNYLLLIQVYLEVCHDILLTESWNVSGNQQEQEEEEFPSLGAETKNLPEVEFFGSPSKKVASVFDRPREQFPDLAHEFGISSTTTTTTTTTQNWGSKAKAQQSSSMTFQFPAAYANKKPLINAKQSNQSSSTISPNQDRINLSWKQNSSNFPDLADMIEIDSYSKTNQPPVSNWRAASTLTCSQCSKQLPKGSPKVSKCQSCLKIEYSKKKGQDKRRQDAFNLNGLNFRGGR